MCPDPKEESEDSILIKALKGRDIARLESLSSVPGLVNAPDQNKQTPLHISCHLGFEAEAICLLKNGASLEARDIVGRTPLSTAALAGNSALVLLLIESGADKASVDGWEQTPLHHACRAGSLVSVTALLTATPTKHLITYMDRLSSFSSTALMCACMAGEISIVRQLLEHGADPNITNRINGIVWLGTFRLPSSAVGLQILNLLASFGANLFGGDDYGWNHLHVNALRGRADVCRELIRISMNGPKLDGAQVTATTPLSPVRTLKLDVNATTRPGDTAIFLAARNGHLDTVRCLLELGADATIKCRIQDQDGRVDRESSTPLMAASYFGHAETVSCLISSGLDLHQASADMTPLYVAAQRGHLETCQKLLDAGADKNFMKKKDESVLSIAARNGKADVLELLLKKGAIAWPTAFLRKSNKTLRFESGVPEESRQKIKSLLRKYLGSGL
jgi:ankyrin repeat protein